MQTSVAEGGGSATKDKKTTPTRVRFAPSPVVLEISSPTPSSVWDQSQEEEALHVEDSTPQPAGRDGHSSDQHRKLEIADAETVDDEDDDDDW